MTVRIFPCFRCPLREGCAEKKALAVKVAGLGARSVAFPCIKLGAELRRGRRIIVKAPLIGLDECAGTFRAGTAEVKATVTGVHPHYCFMCVVDPKQIDKGDMAADADARRVRFRRWRPHYRVVRFLDEPDGSFCASGELLRDGVCDTFEGNCLCDAASIGTASPG